jgi:hypothetical protein
MVNENRFIIQKQALMRNWNKNKYPEKKFSAMFNKFKHFPSKCLRIIANKKHAHENAPIIKIRSGYGRVELQCDTPKPRSLFLAA